MFNRLRAVWFVIGLLGIACLLACSGQNDSEKSGGGSVENDVQDASKQAVITFDTLSHDFGTIIEGEMVVCYFRYENTGEADLVINSVEATCGCTTPDWSQEPIKPGDGEYLKIVFDATGRSGAQRKVVTVRSNAGNSSVRLTLSANVNSSV